MTAWVHGVVQGVGFRWWVRSRALELGLAGSATNLDDGRVEVVAEGPDAACRSLSTHLETGPRGARVAGVEVRWSPPKGAGPGFEER